MTDNGSNVCRAFSLAVDEDDNKDYHSDQDNDEDETFYRTMGLEEESDEMLETIETDISYKFSTFSKRLSCFAHTLDLIARRIDKDKNFIQLINGVSDILSYLQRSSLAKQEIKSITSYNFRSICKTRWTYRYFWLLQLERLRGGLDSVCDKFNFDRIQQSQWDRIKIFKDLLQMFAELSGFCEGDQYSTLSSVIPGILGLQLSLKNLVASATTQDISTVLLKDIEARFNHILNTNNPNFDPIYSLATMLDPEHFWILNNEQVQAAKKEIESLMPNDIVEISSLPQTISEEIGE